MKKFIITCPSCKKKMRILNKPAKYKCPSCGNIHKIGKIKFIFIAIKSFFVGIVDTIKDIKNNIIYKYNSAKTTYKYMSQLKKNMKNDPNWSNFRTQQQEEKKMRDANKKSFKDFFKRKKK